MIAPRIATASRSIVVQIAITAPADVVWKALTDPAELVRWFPLEARVVPGVDGSMWLSWGEPIVACSRISIWEPEYHLRTVEVEPFGAILKENAGVVRSGDQDTTPPHADIQRCVDYFVDQSQEGTILRVVHSGFDGSSDCADHSLEGIRRGWEFELLSLQLYLERHCGKQRSVVWVRRIVGMSPENLWNSIMGPSGLIGAMWPQGPQKGDCCLLQAATGDVFEGTVQIYDAPNQFAATITNLDDSLLRIKLDESIADNAVELNFWLAGYGLSEIELKRIEQRWTNLLDRVFAGKGAC